MRRYAKVYEARGRCGPSAERLPTGSVAHRSRSFCRADSGPKLLRARGARPLDRGSVM